MLRQGHGVSRKKESSPRRRSLPRRGYVCLGELEDKKCGVSGSPRRGFARLGEPLRLGEGSLRLGKPVNA